VLGAVLLPDGSTWLKVLLLLLLRRRAALA
jgi:hypothetical protein